MPDLPQRPSLEHLREQAKARIERALVLADAAELSSPLQADPAAATAHVDGRLRCSCFDRQPAISVGSLRT